MQELEPTQVVPAVDCDFSNKAAGLPAIGVHYTPLPPLHTLG